MGRKELNPADQQRKKNRKKELRINKEKRDVVRSVRVMLSDPDKIEEEIQKAQKASDGSKLDIELKDKIKELKMMKSVALGKQKLDMASGKFERDKAEKLREAELVRRQNAREGKVEKTAYEPSSSSSSSVTGDGEAEKKLDPFHPLSDQLNRPINSIIPSSQATESSVISAPSFRPPPAFAYQPMSQEVQRAPAPIQNAPVPIQRGIAPMLTFDAPPPGPPAVEPPSFRPPAPSAPTFNLPVPLFTTGNEHQDSSPRGEIDGAKWNTDGGNHQSEQDMVDQRRIEEIDRMIAEAEQTDMSSQFHIDTSEYENEGHDNREQFEDPDQRENEEHGDSNMGLFSDEVDQNDEDDVDMEQEQPENSGNDEKDSWEVEGEESSYSHPIVERPVGPSAFPSSSFNPSDYALPSAEELMKRRLASAESIADDDSMNDGPSYPSSAFSASDYTLPTAQEIMNRRFAVSHAKTKADEEDEIQKKEKPGEKDINDSVDVPKKGIFMPPSYKAIPLPFAVSSGGLGGLAGYGSDSDEESSDNIKTAVEIPLFVPKEYPIVNTDPRDQVYSHGNTTDKPVYSHATKPIVEKIVEKQLPVQSHPPPIQNRVEDDVAAFLASIENNEIENSSSMVEYKGDKQGMAATSVNNPTSVPSEKPLLKAIKRDKELTAFRLYL
jgi:hypothetical protein